MVANIFGQIHAVTQRIRIQNQLNSITRAVARIIKESTHNEKQLNAYKRALTNDAKQSNSIFYSRNACMQRVIAQGGTSFSVLFNDDGSLNSDACNKNAAVYQAFQNSVQQEMADGQQKLQQSLEEIEEYFESEYSIKVEALKDEQTDLETEKVGLQAQLDIVTKLEQQEQQFASNNIKSMFDNRG